MRVRSIVGAALLLALFGPGLRAHAAHDVKTGMIPTASYGSVCNLSLGCAPWANSGCDPASPWRNNDVNPFIDIHDVGSLTSVTRNMDLTALAPPVGALPVSYVYVLFTMTEDCKFVGQNAGVFLINNIAPGETYRNIPVPKNTKWLLVSLAGFPGAAAQAASYKLDLNVH